MALTTSSVDPHRTAHDRIITAALEELLVPETAAKILHYRVPAEVAARVEVLREKAGEGELTSAEDQEYAGIIDAMDQIAIIQIRARRMLGGERQWRLTPLHAGSCSVARAGVANIAARRSLACRSARTSTTSAPASTAAATTRRT